MFMINEYLTEIWLIIGVICIIAEFFTIPNIGFLFFGFGALLNALIIYHYPLINLTNQITIFGLLSLIWFCILYYPLKKYVYSKTTSNENYSDMIGKEAEVYSELISEENLGQVKWSGVIMNAYLAPNEKAKSGDKVFITKVKGNILICSKHRPKN
ncbi:MAG TPA: NfeD family protein [Rickettsia endosymbiont of Columbicola hoogstraali]|nr:NfeD family protein [Rickettsia endosymbiont of Columbicola hoogstraali]